MPTTIDSLQIEIQSNSTNAAQAIDSLATSLGNLKKNGAVGTAIKNLGALSDKLSNFTDAANATRAIGKLVGALGNLKGVGSVASVGNSLTKLSESIKTLDNVNLDGLDEKIKSIAAAVAPLSNIKSGGLGTMVNALGKIGDVTASLDDSKIAAFAERVSKLNEVLEPLSTKMTTVQAGLRGINSSARSAGASAKEMGDKLNTTSINLASFIHNVQNAVRWVKELVQKFSEFISDAIEWDGVSARFGRGFGPQAQKTYNWIQRLNEEMGINVQQFMQYSSIYATMLTGFGVAQEDAAQMALGYTELTYDIWAGYNDIYKNYADAADAVKSAIAGEVEPIRRAGFTIIESTLEQTAANHGLKISLANATEAQKSYLRYLTLVDQAHSQNLVGTYAKELNTAEGLMRTFSQQLKSFAQSLGSLFLPVLTRILPYLQAFVDLLTEGVMALAALFGVEIRGVDWSGYNSGVGAAVSGTEDLGEAMGDAASAAKELQNATIGIDELNVISPPSGSGGGAGGGASGFDGLDIDSLWDESIFKNINDQVDAVKEKLEGWMPVIETIGASLGALAILTLLSNLGEGLAKMNEMEGMVATLQKALAAIAILTIEAVLVFALADNYLETGNLMSAIGEALTTAAGGYLMYKGFGDKGLIVSLAVSLLAQLAAITLNLADGGVEMDDPQLWIQSAISAATAGAAGYWLAHKGLVNMSVGQGIGFGVLAGLSLTLAAITIGEVTANGVDFASVISGALSTLLGGAAGAGILSALGIASGGTAFLIGAAVMLSVNLIGAVIGSITAGAKRDMEKDMEARFGEMELNVSEIKVLVDKLTPEWTDATALAVELRKDLSSLLESIQDELSRQNGYEWRISVGIGLNDDEMGAYKNSIDRYITQAQQYIADRGYALEVGLKATGASEAVIESATSISDVAYTELEQLGKSLQDTLNTAYEDGLLDIDELEAVQTIKEDMQTIVDTLAASEIKAEFGMFEMQWSGVDLTAESFTALMQDMNNTLETKVKPELEATVNANLSNLEANVAFAKLKYDQSETPEEKENWASELAKAESAIQEYIDQNPLENLTLEASIPYVTFALNTLQGAFQDALDRARNEGWLDYETQLDWTLMVRPDLKISAEGEETYADLVQLTDEMRSIIGDYTNQLSAEAKTEIDDMLSVLQPSMADYEEIAAANRKAGVTVVQSVREGLNDYNELKALTDDTQAINYMIGKGFSTDPTFLNTLKTCETAGKQLDESMKRGLVANLEFVTDAATGLVIGIRDAVNDQTIYMTPALRKNMEDLGINLGDALGNQYSYVYNETTGMLEGILDSTTGNMTRIEKDLGAAAESAGSVMSDSLNKGANRKMDSQTRGIRTWARKPWSLFTEENGISGSSSTLFKSGGESLVSGLLAGIPANSLCSRLSTVWGTAKGWWDEKPSLSTITPSVGDILTPLQTKWNDASTWFNKQSLRLNVKVPQIDTNWADVASSNQKSSAKVLFGREQVPKVGLQWYAGGGFPSVGELFVARENGPEMVGRVGGQSAVANNDQIVESISAGVYNAMISALRTASSGDGQSINVYLDGRQITAAVEKRQRERGSSLMGTQVYSY